MNFFLSLSLSLSLTPSLSLSFTHFRLFDKSNENAKYFLSREESLITIEKKLKSYKYISVELFVKDVRKMWNSSWINNQPVSDAYIATTKIANYYENLIQDVDNIQFISGSSNKTQRLKRHESKMNNTLKRMTTSNNIYASNRIVKSSPRKGLIKMNSQEKAALTQNIRKLNKEQLLEIGRAHV